MPKLSQADRDLLAAQERKIAAADDRGDVIGSDLAHMRLLRDAEDPKAMAAEWHRRTNQRPY
ncbi:MULTISPECIES: hypothetical protein [Actinomycetes]|uniref:hypothetical protein n=1 Tax=Actinomycetes TaxID=1760 RepID=UPI0019050B7D|nr:hypothetical protein [Streptomyces sp. XC 2026]QQN79742.1 hypothetical protein IPZ77_21690 [Streptomyces sp. XC 2026]QQN80650.1 hypothetical protein IPZ77_26965 [Streptomyces sp. XC 2026]